MKSRKIGLILLILSLINLTILSETKALEYSLGVEVGDEYSWDVLESDENFLMKHKKGDKLVFEVQKIIDEDSSWEIWLRDSDKHISFGFTLNKIPTVGPYFLCPIPVKDYLAELASSSNIASEYNYTTYAWMGAGDVDYGRTKEEYEFEPSSGWAKYMKFTAENGTVIFELKAVPIDDQTNDDQVNDAVSNQNLILGIVILSLALMGISISILIKKKKKSSQEIESQKQIKTQEFCKQCGEMVNVQDNFCDNCGKTLVKK